MLNRATDPRFLSQNTYRFDVVLTDGSTGQVEGYGTTLNSVRARVLRKVSVARIVGAERTHVRGRAV